MAKTKTSQSKVTKTKRDVKKPAAPLFTDNKKGSSELVIELNTLIKANLKKKDYILELIKEAKKELRSFAVVQNYLSEVDKLLKKNPLSLSEYVYNFERDAAAVSSRIFKKAKPIFKNVDSIVTISNSGTVFNFIKELAREKKNLTVIVSESRPVMEGRVMARKLLKEKVKVIFITEAMLPQYINQSDAVVIGADVLLRNGNVVNKTGSRSAAILAKYFSKPFYVLAEKIKYSKGTTYDSGVHPPVELWNQKEDRLTVVNFYFEEVRADLVTKIITD